MSWPTRGPDEGAAPSSHEERVIRLEEDQAESTAPEAGALPSLSSIDVAERRLALMNILHWGLEEKDVEQVKNLASDRHPDVRRLALEALSTAGRADDAVLQAALADPTDEVRAFAVRLAARSGRFLARLVPLLAATGWPLTQRATFEVVPPLIARVEIMGDQELRALLEAIAGLEALPLEEGSEAVAQIARVVGRARLLEMLPLRDELRLGAARLLLEEGSLHALRAVAALSSDPLAGVRDVATRASRRLDVYGAGEAWAQETTEAGGPEPAGSIGTMAIGTKSPNRFVRLNAWRDLSEADPAVLSRWVTDTLESDDTDTAAIAARVADQFTLRQVAPQLFRRCSALPREVGEETRAPFITALRSFGLGPEYLVRLVGELEPGLRPAGVRVAGQVGRIDVLPHLRSLLADDYGPVRQAVLEVFGESGEPARDEVAMDALRTDPSPAVRMTAVKGLAGTGRDRRLLALELALSDGSPDVRAEGVDRLLVGLGSEAEPCLLAAVRDPVELVWEAVLRTLTRLQGDEDLLWLALRRCTSLRREELLAVLHLSQRALLARSALDRATDPDPDARVLVMELARRAAEPAALGAALERLEDPAAQVRRAAARTLATLGSPASVEPLGRAIADPDPDTRAEVVGALGAVDDRAALRYLLACTTDPLARVRRLAIGALNGWTGPDVEERLVAALSDPDIRDEAALALARMGPSIVDRLIDALLEGEPAVAPIAGNVLQRVAGPERFAAGLGSLDPEERLRAVVGIGTVGGEDVVEELVRTLMDPDERVRIRGARFLGARSERRATEALERSLVADPVPSVVAAVREALDRLQPQARPA